MNGVVGHLSTLSALVLAPIAVAANPQYAAKVRVQSLCISDKPLHGAPKIAEQAERFYDASRRAHLEIALVCIDLGLVAMRAARRRIRA